MWRIKKSRISYTHYMSNYDYRHVAYAESCAYASARVPSSEPVSSIWDTSPEEDVAYCLMMLSRDKWRKKEKEKDQKQDKVTKTRTRGKYKCETCSKFFRSYQALGGHVASHKKIKVSTNKTSETVETKYKEVKIHECPVCSRVFSSGQALGGHKRSHGITSTKIKLSRIDRTMIDLNVPASLEDAEIITQIEFSSVSDAKFVNPIKPLKVKLL
ncbi:zinc finger protein zat9 [Nicotiana attenuata]|uniref:Zinc finger protein zat9 n=1 Tax=Nicotiana attenuata TaxID=49451 RepID=A0A1J6J0K4_NICAT|nr:zinc finger protein zat9 [Nicotiana attenuata]